MITFQERSQEEKEDLSEEIDECSELVSMLNPEANLKKHRTNIWCIQSNVADFFFFVKMNEELFTAAMFQCFYQVGIGVHV